MAPCRVSVRRPKTNRHKRMYSGLMYSQEVSVLSVAVLATYPNSQIVCLQICAIIVVRDPAALKCMGERQHTIEIMIVAWQVRHDDVRMLPWEDAFHYDLLIMSLFYTRRQNSHDLTPHLLNQMPQKQPTQSHFTQAIVPPLHPSDRNILSLTPTHLLQQQPYPA